MSGLLDILQAASNSAASNVSAPVDVLAWLLRKAGIPVDEPVGGSAWMEKRGLTRPVQQGAANVVGETLGLVSPMAAAAKAPQVAKGLLTMADNAAAPATLSPEAGAIVWHGGGAKFAPTPRNPLGEFDPTKIGTGEGNQAIAYGHYVADREKTAKYYRDWMALNQGKPGHLYKVDLADDAIPKLLDWNKPLIQDDIARFLPSGTTTDDAIRAAKEFEYLSQAVLDGKVTTAQWDSARMSPLVRLGEMILDSQKQKGRFGYDTASRQTGAKLYESLTGATGGNKKASEYLRQAGIPGVRYLDQGSLATGTGTSNYVIFPGEEGLLRILERY